MAKLATRSEKLVASGPNPVALETPQVATSSPAYKAGVFIMTSGKVMKTIFSPKLCVFIIWQDSLEVNLSILIDSFLVGILPYGPFPWKQSYGVYFCSRKLANSNYEKKTFKYSHLRKKLLKKIDILQSLQ